MSVYTKTEEIKMTGMTYQSYQMTLFKIFSDSQKDNIVHVPKV